MRSHIRHITSVCVVFCVHIYSFAGLIRRTSPQTFSETAVTDRYSDTTLFLIDVKMPRSAKDESEIELCVPETF